MGSSASKVAKGSDIETRELKDSAIIVIERPVEIIKDEEEFDIINIEVKNFDENASEIGNSTQGVEELCFQTATPKISPISKCSPKIDHNPTNMELTDKSRGEEQYTENFYEEKNAAHWDLAAESRKSITPLTRMTCRPAYLSSKSRNKTLCDKYPNIYAKAIESIIPALECYERNSKPLHDLKNCFDEVSSRSQFESNMNKYSGKYYQHINKGECKQLSPEVDLNNSGNLEQVKQDSHWRTARMGDTAWVHYPTNQINPNYFSKNLKNQKKFSAVTLKKTVNNFNELPVDAILMDDINETGDSKIYRTTRARTRRNISKRGYMDIICKRDNNVSLRKNCKDYQSTMKTQIFPSNRKLNAENNYDILSETIRNNSGQIYKTNRAHTSTSSPLSCHSKASDGSFMEQQLNKIKQKDCSDAISRLAISELNRPWNKYGSTYRRESRSDGDSDIYRRSS